VWRETASDGNGRVTAADTYQLATASQQNHRPVRRRARGLVAIHRNARKRAERFIDAEFP
jgi:hypothetical protein